MKLMKSMLYLLGEGLKEIFAILISIAIVLGIPIGLIILLLNVLKKNYGQEFSSGFVAGAGFVILILILIAGIRDWVNKAKERIEETE